LQRNADAARLRYGVWLIPKRYFAEVIGGANATIEGASSFDFRGTPHGGTRGKSVVLSIEIASDDGHS
jgi:hypothetical protein